MNGLDRIREAAERDRNLRFTNLMHHLTAELLRESYGALKRTAAAGVDDVTWQEYGEGLESRIMDLHDRVQSGRYRAKPSKRVWLPKPDGRHRPIGIAALDPSANGKANHSRRRGPKKWPNSANWLTRPKLRACFSFPDLDRPTELWNMG